MCLLLLSEYLILSTNWIFFILIKLWKLLHQDQWAFYTPCLHTGDQQLSRNTRPQFVMMCNFKLIVVCVCADSSRVKRMCVAERRQPYSGADWCSGGESDEDDKGFFSKRTCASKRAR